MNKISEFTIVRCGSNGATDAVTWRWLPQDGRAQHLHADGYLPPDLDGEFARVADSAILFVVGTDAFYDEDHALAAAAAINTEVMQATLEQKLEMLDGFVMIMRAGNLYPLPEDEASGPDVVSWNGHQALLPANVTLISAEEWAALPPPLEPQPNATAIQAIEEAGILWDAKIARYKKLGWDQDDCLAEFGSRPRLNQTMMKG